MSCSSFCFVSGFGHSHSMFCLVVGAGSLTDRVRPHALLLSCGVAHSLYFSLAVCFRKPLSHCTLVPENCLKIAGVPSV